MEHKKSQSNLSLLLLTAARKLKGLYAAKAPIGPDP